MLFFSNPHFSLLALKICLHSPCDWPLFPFEVRSATRRAVFHTHPLDCSLWIADSFPSPSSAGILDRRSSIVKSPFHDLCQLLTCCTLISPPRCYRPSPTFGRTFHRVFIWDFYSIESHSPPLMACLQTKSPIGLPVPTFDRFEDTCLYSVVIGIRYILPAWLPLRIVARNVLRL